MPPQNPYPKHQQGQWLEARTQMWGDPSYNIDLMFKDFKIKDGEIVYIMIQTIIIGG